MPRPEIGERLPLTKESRAEAPDRSVSIEEVYNGIIKSELFPWLYMSLRQNPPPINLSIPGVRASLADFMLLQFYRAKTAEETDGGNQALDEFAALAKWTGQLRDLRIDPFQKFAPRISSEPKAKEEVNNFLATLGRPVHLKPREKELLGYFCAHPYEGCAYEELIEAMGVKEGKPESAMGLIKNYVSYLRKKIEPDSENPQYLVNVWGRGYIFLPEPSPEITGANQVFNQQEYYLFMTLATQYTQMVSHKQIMEALNLWSKMDVKDRIHRVRRKLPPGLTIENVYGAGYRMRANR